MGKSFRLALKSIWSNKMRSFLTMLGIIIGVAAVIILVGLVNGQMNYVKESFFSMGTNQVMVTLNNENTRSVSSQEMYDFFEENGAYFDAVSPNVTVMGTVKAGNESLDSTAIAGVSEDYLRIKDEELEAGRFLRYSDMVSRQKVCVIGCYTAEELFGGAKKALGEKLRINGETYRIVGCVEKQAAEGEEPEAGGSDDVLYLPYTSAVLLAKNGTINSYIFTVWDVEDTDAVKALFQSFLYPIFKDEDFYQVMAMGELLDSLDSVIGMMSVVMGGIAGISLLVAGVGVMNIMLVSVTERTREIGIRKSLGARRRTILQQFVMEAAVTSSIGGILGIGLGCILTGVVGDLLGVKAVPTLGSILVSFSVSVGIGLLFGYMPARRAAGLNPIDALRSD